MTETAALTQQGSGGPLGKLIDLVAGVKASVRNKLLAGFLFGALLLLAMAVMSLLVINSMSNEVAHLVQFHQNVDTARQMEYAVTAQSHFRGMALLTRDDANNDKIAAAKNGFLENLTRVEAASPGDTKPFFENVRQINNRFSASSDRVLSLYRAGDTAQALGIHLAEEHTISHELEAAMRDLEARTLKEMDAGVAAFKSDTGFLTTMVIGFSAISLVTALVLGFIFSLSFTRPVQSIQSVLSGVIGGDYSRRALVPNRDEFGVLSTHLNTMAQELGRLYGELRELNQTLQQRVEEQVQELEHTRELKRYVSPQIAESILRGERTVQLLSTRKNLTVMFSDIRGFTPLSERMETEELIDLLNDYLSEMTEIIFKHGGTLDKYIGDGIMAFFGDPIPYEDHANRAVQAALDMQSRLQELREKWFARSQEELTIGIGIVTGYVTVGNIGSSARMDYTVIGNNVNLASRLADRATPGQILVTDRTLTQVRDLVNANEVAAVELEGVSRPVAVYEVTGRTA